MNVYLMRHAEAVSASDWVGSDQDRPLSPIGIAKLDEGLKEIKRLKLPPMRVLSSPYFRAHTTAALLTQGLGWEKPTVDPRLASGAFAEAIRQTILDQPPAEPLLIVGHMPELAVFASRVTLEAKLLDTGLLPADIVAIDTGDLAAGWGNGKMLWWRKLADWKKVSSL
jgi:phosphohistidine phosphatase